MLEQVVGAQAAAEQEWIAYRRSIRILQVHDVRSPNFPPGLGS